MPFTLNPIGSYRTGIFNDGAAEIVAHDPETQQLFITNGSDKTVDVVDISDPSNPTKTGTLDSPPEFADLAATSVAVNDGIVAVAVPADPDTDPGHVLFFDTDGNFETSVEVGALPDMVTFTPDGTKLLVANEGQLDDDTGVDPDGSVSVIDISAGLDSISIATADFTAFNGQEDALRAEGVRIFDGKTVAQDVEPEFIAVSPDGTTAFVTLQENNAFGVVDIATATITDILPLGGKDHSVAGNELDASDDDGAINIQNWPVIGMYMSDAVASYEVDGQTYYVTANEGDDRGEDVRVNELTLDPSAFPNAAELQADENLGRLNVSSVDGDTDGDGDFDQLFSFGARSFSIWDQSGDLVFDSGAQMEQITAALIPDYFNTDNDENVFDSKSDSQGPEPEGLTVGQVGEQTLVFVGFEDVGGVIVFDITNPHDPTFQSYRNDRDFTVEPSEDSPDVSDLAPEGLTFIPEDESPNGEPLLVVANEVSGSTTLYEVTGPTLSIEITHFTEDAWYANTFGIYNTETGEAEILETNTDLDTNGDLSPGDVLATLELTAEEYENLGYFIVGNGNRMNHYDGLNLEGAMVVENADGVYGIQLADGSFLNGAGAPAFFSEASKNSDGEDHFDERGTDTETVFLVEDLADLGDQDFDDLIYTVTATPIEELEADMLLA